MVSNGPHADVVKRAEEPRARIPDGVGDDAASFTVVGQHRTQWHPAPEPTLGGPFVVTGASLIGLLTVQLLRAHGCRVLAIDVDDAKLALARQLAVPTVCNPPGRRRSGRRRRSRSRGRAWTA